MGSESTAVALYAAVVIREALDAIIVVDAAGIIRDWNPRAEAIFGWSREEIVGRAVVDTIAPERFREPYRKGLARQSQTGESVVGGKTVDAHGRHRDGHEFPLRLTIWRSGAGADALFVGMVREPHRRRQAGSGMDPVRQEAAQLSQLLLESAGVGACGLDRQGHITFANPAAERILGLTRDELVGSDMHALVHHSHADGSPYAREDCPITLVIERSEAVTVDDEVLWTKDGNAVPVEYSANPVLIDGKFAGAVVTFSDISSRLVRRRVERQKDKVERLEGNGKLARVVAHDFNNLLSVIINYAGFVREALGSGAAVPNEETWRAVDDDVQQIERAAARATSLTQQLLAFARTEAVQLDVINVTDIVRAVELTLRSTFGGVLKIVVSLVEHPRPVLMDPSKLEQVLLSLCINAKEAMPAGGTLTVTSENVDLGLDPDGYLPGIPFGRYVRLSVSDTGTGMTDEVKAHVFEPFFTTKGSGGSAGLGLATAHRIVTQAGGEIHFDSVPSLGTTFAVLLPEHLPAGPASP
jgi:PAS domain S-box-containing protein